MNEPPSRHDITIWVATEEAASPTRPRSRSRPAGQPQPGTPAFSARTAEQIICVVTVPAATGPEAAAVVLAVADALTAEDPAMSPDR